MCMKAKLGQVLREAENNIYNGADLPKGAIVFIWTLLCLFLINKNSNFLYAAAFGVAYYLSVIILCLLLFKDIYKYLAFPAEKKEIPRFIGHKTDMIFTYPLLLMSLIGIIGNLLAAAGFTASGPGQVNTVGAAGFREFIVRIVFMPLAALSEELLNLLLVSFIYNSIKLKGSCRLIGSIFFAALIFGALHAFGWGFYAAIPIGIAYIPVFVSTLYTGNVWISFLAHFYNDLISTTKYYYGSFHFIIIAGIALIPAVWATGTIIRKLR